MYSIAAPKNSPDQTPITMSPEDAQMRIGTLISIAEIFEVAILPEPTSHDLGVNNV